MVRQPGSSAIASAIRVLIVALGLSLVASGARAQTCPYSVNNRPDPSDCVPDDCVIDVLVFYTPAIAQWYADNEALSISQGNPPTIEGWVIEAEAYANQAFANSEIDAYVSIVAVIELTGYVEEPELILDQQKYPRVDNVPDIRGRIGADVVTLLRSNSGHLSGAAPICMSDRDGDGFPEAYPSEAYNVVKNTYWAFTHELGHVLGCDHYDISNILKPPACP